FTLARGVFVLYYLQQARALPAPTLRLAFLYGLRMDLSMAAYLLVPVCLMVMAGLFLPFFRRALPYQVYSGIVLFLVLLIVLSDLEIYRSWGFRIDATP